jgi:hypothetical protein
MELFPGAPVEAVEAISFSLAQALEKLGGDELFQASTPTTTYRSVESQIGIAPPSLSSSWCPSPKSSSALFHPHSPSLRTEAIRCAAMQSDACRTDAIRRNRQVHDPVAAKVDDLNGRKKEERLRQIVLREQKKAMQRVA